MTFVVQVLNGLSFSALLFVLTSGFTVTYGLMRIVNLAHGGFYLVGGYFGYSVAERTGSFWLALVAGVVGTALLGVLTERILLRQVRNQILSEVLLTVGLAIIISDVALALWGGTPEGISVPQSLNGAMTFGSIVYPKFRLAVIVFALLVALLLYLLQNRTRIGAIVRAGVDERETVAALGVNVDRIFGGVFAFGAALAGLAGVIGGALLTLAPGEDTKILLYALVVVVLGGAGSLAGAALGSIAIGLIDVFTKTYIPDLSYFTIFAPMLLILVVRPRGLFGKAA